MSFKFRSVPVGVVLVVTALVLAACGGDDDGTADEPEDGEEAEVTLTWQFWSGSEVETRVLENLKAMVAEEYPNITVELETATFMDYWTRLAAQASAGEVGCVLGVQAGRASTIPDLMLPLTDDLLSEAEIDLSEHEPTITEALRIDGDLLAVPYDLGPLTIYYNTEAFEAAGVEAPPVSGWTVDEFVEAAGALSDGGMSGFATPPYIDAFMVWALALEGLQAVNEDGELDLDNSGMVAASEFLADLQEQGIVASMPATTDANYGLNEFVAGNAAMIVDGPWQLGFIRENAGFEAGMAPMPRNPDGTGSHVNGSGYGVSASCEHPKEALQVISVLTGPDALQFMAEEGRAFSSRPAHQNSWFAGEFPGAVEVLTAALEDAVGMRTTPNWTEVSELFQRSSVQVINGDLSPEEFGTSLQEQLAE